MIAGFRKHSTTIAISMIVAALFAAVPAVAAVINATTLNHYKANELIRVSRRTITDNALLGSGVAATVISTKILAPKKGYLVVTSSSDVFGGPDTDTCVLTLDGTQLSGSKRTFALTADNSEGNCNTDIAWPVGPGKHIVALVATNPATGVTYDEATIEVLFVPFGASGKVPTPIPPALPARGSSGN